MKISWFSVGRVAVFLRRIAVAAERSADAAEAQVELLQRMWEVENPSHARRRSSTPKSMEIGTLDVAAANRRYREDYPNANTPPDIEAPSD